MRQHLAGRQDQRKGFLWFWFLCSCFSFVYFNMVLDPTDVPSRNQREERE